MTLWLVSQNEPDRSDYHLSDALLNTLNSSVGIDDEVEIHRRVCSNPEEPTFGGYPCRFQSVRIFVAQNCGTGAAKKADIERDIRDLDADEVEECIKLWPIQDAAESVER
ncbi:unnamed protein product, partial [Mesorhabditis spiculigera]